MKLWEKNVSLSDHCSWHIGGTADCFFEPASETELFDALEKAKSRSMPVYIIGKGSNILFADKGVRGLVIALGSKFGRVSVEDTTFRAEAGAYMPMVARKSMLAGLRGLEHTIGIPGTVGGLTVMNGGSMRHCLNENIVNVRALNRRTLESKVFPEAECVFGYRASIFQRSEWIVTEVEFRLEPGERRTIRREMLEIMSSRRQKFPLKAPSCGSVFKSEPEIYRTHGAPGLIIERLGFKGMRCGGAMISEQHANFIVNCGNAAARDVLTLTERIKTAAREKFGIELHEEYMKVGDFS